MTSNRRGITGRWGNIASHSFDPTKNLGALGDGGDGATNDPLLARARPRTAASIRHRLGSSTS